MEDVKINGIYKHFKGSLYRVTATAKDSENLKDMVVYEGLYEDHPMWVRPKENFLEKVDKNKYPEASQEYRFELQDTSFSEGD